MAVNLLRPFRGRLLLALAAIVLASSLGDARAPAGTPPPRWERLAEIVTPTIVRLEQLGAGGVAGVPERRVLTRCAERATAAVAACTRGRRPAALGCAARLAATALALDATADRTTDAGAVTAFVGAETARLATLLGALERSRDDCTHPPSDDRVPAILGWREGGTMLEVEPARPLAPGRRHRLVLPPALAVAGTAPRLDARGRLRSEPAPAASLPSIANYGRRVLRLAADVSGVTTRPALALRLVRPIPLAVLTSVTATFEPIEADDDAEGIVVHTIGDDDVMADVRATAVASLAPTRPIDPDERHALGLDTAALARVALRRGTVRSRDPGGGATREVPYLVAIPTARTQSNAVVLLLDGLGGDATRFLRVRGATLLARGLAVVAMDLPTHGMRDDGTPFLDARDPTVLAGHLRTGVADVVALAARLRAPGGLAPESPPPTTIRVLAYSIGASVASVALALDPGLGASVLVAPPGDLTDFLGLATSASFDAPLLRCLSGSALGGPCDGGTCPAGACVFNPVLLPLLDSRTATRTLFAQVDPQTRARAIAGPDGTRPILLQIGGQDGIVAPECTIWLAAALGADLTCTRRADRPQALCRFAPAGHNVVWDRDARRQADVFVASGGMRLAPSGEPWAAR